MFTPPFQPMNAIKRAAWIGASIAALTALSTLLQGSIVLRNLNYWPTVGYVNHSYGHYEEGVKVTDSTNVSEGYEIPAATEDANNTITPGELDLMDTDDGSHWETFN